MKRRTLYIAGMIGVMMSPLTVLAQWSGPSGSPPNNNASGPVWLQSGTPASQTGSFSISGDGEFGDDVIFRNDAQAIEVNGATSRSLNVGNWGSGVVPNTGFVLNVYGHLTMLPGFNSTTPPILTMSGLSRLNVYQICLTGDTCRTTWPSGAVSDIWVDTAGDSMTGALAVNSGAATYGVASTGTVYGLLGAATAGASGRGVFGSGGYAGVHGVSANMGVAGFGGAYGVYGDGSTNWGVRGRGPVAGGYFSHYGSGNQAYIGGSNYAISATGTTYGVYATTTLITSTGVYGSGQSRGVQGVSSNYGVYGDGGYAGVQGIGNVYGVYAIGRNTGSGIYASTNNASGYGVYALGGNSGTGVYGSGGDYGVYGSGGGYGVGGAGTSAGVVGSGSGVGAGVLGFSANGYGGDFNSSGFAAGLHAASNNGPGGYLVSLNNSGLLVRSTNANAIEAYGSITTDSNVISSGGSLRTTNPNNDNANVSLNWLNDIPRIRYGGSGVGNSNGLEIQGPGDTNRVKIYDDGDFRIYGSNAYKVTSGSWIVPSDVRLKNITGAFTYGLDEITQINPIRYRFKEGNAKDVKDTTTEHIGVSAQEIQKLIPDAVSTDEDGYLQLDPDPIHWAVINAIKELKAENDELKARIEALEAK